MDFQLLESLLYQEESDTLDFKVQQYPFVKATDDQKGELLKDILAFANAWGQTDAYILIGVEEVRGGRSIVRGIDPKDHLLNRNLQEFAHKKTNRPVDFWYAPVTFEGVDIGVLTIPRQQRPVYVKEAYGKLAAEVVYIRRRDSTGTAGPEEIARMGSAAVLQSAQPVLEMEFADLALRQRFGTTVTVQSRVVEIPERQKIPLYGPAPTELYGVPIDSADSYRNRDYYRDVAEYIRDKSLLSAMGIAVANPSPTVAEEVRVTFELDAASDLVVLDEAGTPTKPSTFRGPAIRSALFEPRQRVHVKRYGDRYEIRLRIGTTQPGTTEWSEPFYIGARQPMTVAARIQIAANSLRAPISLSAEIVIKIQRVSVSVEDIKRFGKG